MLMLEPKCKQAPFQFFLSTRLRRLPSRAASLLCRLFEASRPKCLTQRLSHQRGSEQTVWNPPLGEKRGAKRRGEKLLVINMASLSKRHAFVHLSLWWWRVGKKLPCRFLASHPCFPRVGILWRSFWRGAAGRIMNRLLRDISLWKSLTAWEIPAARGRGLASSHISMSVKL